MSADQRGWGPGWPNCQRGSVVTVTCGAAGLRLPVRREIAPLIALLVRDLESARGRPFRSDWSWGFGCRAISGTTTASNHSWGLAIDLDSPENPYILAASHRAAHPLRKTFPGGRVLRSTMPDDVVAIAERHGFYWGGLYRRKPDPMHFEFLETPADAARRVGDDGSAGPSLEGVTHRVTVSSLRLRQQPSTSAALIADLPDGTPVEQLGDTPQDKDGHTWFKVSVLAGGRLQQGWVASKYLQATGSTPSPTPPAPSLEAVTHRVTASSLRLRQQPSTSAALIADLGKNPESLGTLLTALIGYMMTVVIASRYASPSALVATMLNPTTMANPSRSGTETSSSWSKWSMST